MYEGLKDNKNAEKWTLEQSIALFENAVKVAKSKKLDFIGEVAQELDTYRDIFTYLKDKFNECKPLYKRLEQECEANCFSHGKNGDIIPSLAIMNLKSNHKWTDRIDNTMNANVNVKSIEPIEWVNAKDKE